MKAATLFKKLPNQVVECTACAWYCRIKPGQTGICGTRLNEKGKLKSLVYGQAIGLSMDPVEKKPLHHFLPGSNLLSFGTVGCNFGCLFCQNFQMSQINKTGQSSGELTELISRMSTQISPRKIVELALSQDAAGIAYTYNEPAIFAEYAHDTMVAAHERGLVNVYVSNGYESPETFNYLKDSLDAINIDLKSFRPEFYRQVCKAKIEPVKENIERFFEAGIETEVTTLVIPGYNDSDGELRGIAEFLVNLSTDIPWHVSAFYPTYKLTDASVTPPETLRRAYDLGKRAGLMYVYVGNVNDSLRSNTRCPRCDQLLVERYGYQTTVKELDLDTGKCNQCGEKIYGRWN